MIMEQKCTHLKDLLDTEMAVIRRHLDEHIFLRKLNDRTEAIHSFIQDYGWLMRELYCAHICAKRAHCAIAVEMRTEGDLLHKRLRKRKPPIKPQRAPIQEHATA